MRKRAFALISAVLGIAVACGGSTRESSSSEGSGATGGSAGRGGSAGTGTIGASGVNGHDGAAGVSGSGSDGAAGFLGSAGDAGRGGTGIGGTGADGGVVTDCYAPPQSYGCEGGDGSFYFDTAAGVCKTYGSFRCSYGSANRFSTLAECLGTCPGARPDVTACDDVSDCEIVDKGCCAACEPVGRDSLEVVNLARVHDFKPPCPPIACGACPPVDELLTTRQYFVPTCGHGTCGILDLRNTEYTACTRDTDCALRDGAQCCQGCDGKGLVATNHLPEVCGHRLIGCPDCGGPSNIPPEFAPKCQQGHCTVMRRPIP